MSNISLQPSSATLSTTDTGSATEFIIQNNTSLTLSIYWIDRSGVEQLYSTLQPGQNYVQSNTVSTHAWEIKSTDNSISYKFYPTSPGKITLTGTNTYTFDDYSEKVTHNLNNDWSTAEGYGLINVAKSLGVADHGYELSMSGQNNNLALNLIKASSAWDAGITGQGVKVAVIDVGIASNPEVNANIVGGYDFFDNDNNPAPDNGAYADHALGVAAIIAGSHSQHLGQDTMGVAPDAQLLNVRVGSSNGSSSDAIAKGIVWAVDNGAKVICMPLQNSGSTIDQTVANAVHYAYTHNVTTVIIGGNFSMYGASGLALIAKSGEAIAVGNYDALGGTPFFSSNSPGANPFPWVVASSSGYEPNTTGGYTYHADGGTSFAGPYVAGLAALLYQQNPNASASDIINKIIAGASVTDSTAKAIAYNPVMTGTSGNDTFVTVGGNQTVDGGSGIDLFQVHGNLSNYSVASNTSGFVLKDNTGLDGVATLTNVERIGFADTTLALDVGKGQNAGEAYRLYQAAFNRTPDATGLSFWLNAMDHGTTLDSVANSFVTSPEFKSLYGANPSNLDLVTAMYHNVLHREPDVDGAKFWVNGMNHGLTADSLLAQFSESPENVAQIAKVIGQGYSYTPWHN